MDFGEAIVKGLTIVGLFYIGLTCFRAISEGNTWRAVSVILLGFFALSLVTFPEARDTLMKSITDMVQKTFPTTIEMEKGTIE